MAFMAPITGAAAPEPENAPDLSRMDDISCTLENVSGIIDTVTVWMVEQDSNPLPRHVECCLHGAQELLAFAKKQHDDLHTQLLRAERNR